MNPELTRPQVGGWVRNLFAEGIEHQPGPFDIQAYTVYLRDGDSTAGDGLERPSR